MFMKSIMIMVTKKKQNKKNIFAVFVFLKLIKRNMGKEIK